MISCRADFFTRMQYRCTIPILANNNSTISIDLRNSNPDDTRVITEFISTIGGLPPLQRVGDVNVYYLVSPNPESGEVRNEWMPKLRDAFDRKCGTTSTLRGNTILFIHLGAREFDKLKEI